MMIQKVTQQKALVLLAYFAALVVVAIVVPDEDLLWLGSIVLLVMIVPANYFPIFYTFAFRWWGGHLGRALFTKALGLAVLINAGMFFKYFGERAWAEEVRFVAYVLVLTGMCYQSVEMTRIRIKAKHKRPVESPVETTDLKGIDVGTGPG